MPPADFDLHRCQMREFGLRPISSDRQAADWMGANRRLRQEIMGRLRREGPLPAAALAGADLERRTTSGWSGERDHQRMLELRGSRVWSRWRAEARGAGSGLVPRTGCRP